MKYILPRKSSLKQIKISDINSPLPDLKNIKESKAIAIGNWLANVIKTNKAIKPYTLLPSKPDFAYLLGVSIGTMQIAFRYVEDLGLIESKQCIGTLVKDLNNKEESFRKLTSKRELAVTAVKKYILDNSLKSGDYLPSPRAISKIIGCSSNTVRLAFEYLSAINILEHKFKNSNETGWVLISTDFTIEEVPDNSDTLVQKVEIDLKNYINKNLKVGDRMPAHAQLSQELSVSVKTIHDALRLLIDEGILLARRGRYGTIVLRMPTNSNIPEKPETSIFASASETAFYYYEKTQNHIKKMIAENYEIGSKFPSILTLSKELNLSHNTIRKAYNNLAKEGYLAFSRGRYGGTYVIDIPETAEQTFKWLAVNPKYAEVYNK
jgi:DNA-binding GntR family transcriptional regulator